MRQKIVGHSETGHRREVAADVAFGDRRGNARDRSPGEDRASDDRALHQLQSLIHLEGIVTFLDEVQNLGAVDREVGFLLIAGGHPWIHLPAKIVEIGGRSLRDFISRNLGHRELDQLVAPPRLDPKRFSEIGLGQEEETDHDIRHLYAGVIDVVLDFDLVSDVPKTSDQNITENGVPQVSDVGGLVGVDIGVLNDGFGGELRFFAPLTAQEPDQYLAAIEEDIEEARACNLHPVDFLGPLSRGRYRLGNLTRSPLELPCEGQCAGPREIPEIAPRRHLEGHRFRAISELALERRGQCFGGAGAD
jgi:hypothetical protein